MQQHAPCRRQSFALVFECQAREIRFSRPPPPASPLGVTAANDGNESEKRTPTEAPPPASCVNCFSLPLLSSNLFSCATPKTTPPADAARSAHSSSLRASDNWRAVRAGAHAIGDQRGREPNPASHRPAAPVRAAVVSVGRDVLSVDEKPKANAHLNHHALDNVRYRCIDGRRENLYRSTFRLSIREWSKRRIAICQAMLALFFFLT